MEVGQYKKSPMCVSQSSSKKKFLTTTDRTSGTIAFGFRLGACLDGCRQPRRTSSMQNVRRNIRCIHERYKRRMLVLNDIIEAKVVIVLTEKSGK